MVKYETSTYDYTTGFSFTRRHDVPHYYGDTVRSLLIATAVISALAIPLLGDLLPYGTTAQVACTIALVLLAGLTNPHGKIVSILNTTIAAVGAFLLESAAVTLYSNDLLLLFMAREAAALLLLFALYFSVKTVRAMFSGRIGKDEPIDEFDAEDAEKNLINEGAND
jgi:hypothetical protein